MLSMVTIFRYDVSFKRRRNCGGKLMRYFKESLEGRKRGLGQILTELKLKDTEVR